MPFYEYRCDACGHELEALQKISAERLVDCPSCGKATLTKLVSAAGFQLKGSGWYVTDFRDGDKSKKDKGDSGSKDGAEPAAAKSDKSGDGADSKKKDDKKSSDAPKTGAKSGASSDSTSK
jgi:putative FmdB family regulatory protein